MMTKMHRFALLGVFFFVAGATAPALAADDSKPSVGESAIKRILNLVLPANTELVTKTEPVVVAQAPAKPAAGGGGKDLVLKIGRAHV